MKPTLGLSVWDLFFNGKISGMIMLILVGMFFITLYKIGSNLVYFNKLKKQAKEFDEAFQNCESLDELYTKCSKATNGSIERIYFQGFTELSKFVGSNRGAFGPLKPKTVVNSCRRAMEAALQQECNIQERKLNLLATFASSAPYIGLLGTVCGILNTFVTIGSTENTNIMSVAPGIAEALVATAAGLLTAITAVFAYNGFVARSEELIVEYEAFIEDVSNILQRHLMIHINRQ